MNKVLKSVMIVGALFISGSTELLAESEFLYDGKWKGKLSSSTSACNGLYIKGDSVSGMFKAKITDSGASVGDVRGKISPDGSMLGKLSSRGFTGAKFELTFNGDQAAGKWGSDQCSGTVKIERTS